MKKRFTEEQIIRVLDEGVAGEKVEEICRRHGISAGTYYNWKAKYGGMTISEAIRLGLSFWKYSLEWLRGRSPDLAQLVRERYQVAVLS